MPVRWVYDCGSSSSRPLLERAVENFVSSKSPTVIDILAISHFDGDHINGIPSLLARTRVHRLLLPYVPLAQRLAMAFRAGIRPSDTLMRFFVNPAEYILAIGGDIGQVVFVPQSRGAVDDDGPVDNQIDADAPLGPLSTRTMEHDEDETEAARAPKATSIVALQPGGRIRLDSCFEFVPYNDASLWGGLISASSTQCRTSVLTF